MSKVDDVKRVLKVEYTNDYGGLRAWMFKEYYDGQCGHSGHKVAKREYFSTLHEICVDYLDRGFIIEIIDSSPQPKA